MIDFSISPLPFIAVALANFVLSWLYYSPVCPWFRTWQKNVGMDPNKTQMTEEDKKAMPRLMGGAVVATFLFSYALQVFVHNVKAADFATGSLVGFVIWLGFVVTHSLNTQFEGRKPVLLIINNVYYLAAYCIFGGVLAIWK
jgi:UDP-N-acetylmuramyl pentapeptide phosphotransferase/UDP-N-acetylglucosamine-1-phosphate transferase